MKRDLSLRIAVVVTVVLFARCADAAPLLAEQIKRSPEYYLLFFTGLAVLFFSLIGLKMRTDRNRTSSVEAVARLLGRPFRAEAKPPDYALLKGSRLDGAGSLQLMSNILEAVKTEELELTVFDYQFNINYGTSSATKYQTISRIQSPLLNLPPFYLAPENFMTWLGKLGGLDEIEIPGATTFNKKYLVTGDNETAVCAILTPEVREFLDTLQYVTIESAPPLFFVIRAPWKFQTVSTAMVDEDKRIFAVFLDAQQSIKL